MKSTKKIIKKILIVVFIIFSLFAIGTLVTYISIRKQLDNASFGVSLDPQEVYKENTIGKFYNKTFNTYSVYGKYVMIDEANKWIGLIGANGDFWKIRFNDDTYFRYQTNYKNGTNFDGIYAFTYFDIDRFFEDTRFGMMIRIHCKDKICQDAKGIIVIDKNNKYNYR